MTKQAQYSQKHYAANREEIIRKNAERTKAIRSWVREYKRSLGCKHCPEMEPCCLDFHHRDRTTKLATIAEVITLGWSLERLKQEIAKCNVECANCHRKIHAGLIKED